MFQLIAAMLSVIATWLLWATVFVGLGWLVVRMLSGGLKPSCFRLAGTSLPLAFWLGWGGVIVFLQMWHLFLPVDLRAAATVVVIGLASVVLHRRQFQQALRAVSAIDRRALAAGVITVILWSSIALGPPLNFDTGLYHMTAVRWNASHSIVPGLGNLHGRLAFNNSSFLYGAMLGVGPWAGKSHHLSNGLLSLAVLLPMVGATVRLMRHKQSGETGRATPSWEESLWMVLLFPATILWCYKQTTSFTPDLVVYLLGIVLSVRLLSMLLELRDKPVAGDHGKPAALRAKALTVWFLSAVGVTVKLSFAPMGLAASLIAIGCVVFDRTTSTEQTTGKWGRIPPPGMLLAGLCVVLLTAVPWMLRGVILSGYIAYPQTFGGVDVSWKVPREAVVAEGNSIRAWARNRLLPTDEVLRDSSWIGPWLKHQSRSALHVMVPVVCMLIGITLGWRGRRKTVLWWVLLPSALTLLVVLVTAPDLRFGGASLWILGAGTVAIAIGQMDRPSHLFRHTARATRIVWVVLMVIVTAKAIRYANGPGPDGGFHTTPTAELERFDTRSHDTVIVPTDREDGRTWDAPLPNTPYPNARLSRRDPDDLGRGFLIR